MTKGTIYNIQPFSVHDGPGIRTTVFLKGCNLRCQWCHNPESWKSAREIQFYPEKCIGCGACFSACPQGAHMAQLGIREFLRERCVGCGKCADYCYAGALTLTGEEVDEQRLFSLIRQDQPYYAKTGGGVTFSGGECMMQPDLLCATARLCKEAGIHVAIDTAGCQPFSRFEQVLPWADLFLYDLKGWDEALHKQNTGVSNRLILDNLERLLAAGANVFIRIPCIPGVNMPDVEQLAPYLKDRPVQLVELLGYHGLGEGKFASLGMEGQKGQTPTNQEMEDLAALFRAQGLPVKYTN